MSNEEFSGFTMGVAFRPSSVNPLNSFYIQIGALKCQETVVTTIQPEDQKESQKKIDMSLAMKGI